jgi:nitrogen fixation NifU-like protein
MDLRDLYQEVIIDHNRQPRNFHTMDHPSSSAEGFNPLCGDKLSLFLNIKNDHIVDASFVGCGCAISTASASLMTEAVKGLSLQDTQKLFEQFHDFMIKEDSHMPDLGKLSVLAGVRTYPSRVKCATLAWHTLEAALTRSHEVVSTEEGSDTISSSEASPFIQTKTLSELDNSGSESLPLLRGKVPDRADGG